MRYWMLVCEGLADEPIAEFSGRTPLELAKTPFMDQLAKKGKVGTASFVPHGLPCAPDAACLSMLGYDAAELYSGAAPLDALAFGVAQTDDEVVFRCDLVTTLDGVMIDPHAGLISPREATYLIEAVNKKCSGEGFRLCAGNGYKNLLIVRGASADEFDEVRCEPPSRLVGEKLAKHFPKGDAGKKLVKWMEEAHAVLESHEINRVRVDLGENPANSIWLWGQGKKPKLPTFKQKYGKSGAVFSESNFVKGLGKGLGLELAGDLLSVMPKKEFVFVYFGGSEGLAAPDLKAKIKKIEEFDVLVGNVLKALESMGPYRLFVGTGCAESLSKGVSVDGQVPFLMQGTGVEAGPADPFSERAAAQSKLMFEHGHELMEQFLK